MQGASLVHGTASNPIEGANRPPAAVDASRTEVRFSPNWGNPFSMACKRIIDIVGSALLLLLLSPVFLGLLLAVWLSSPGPLL